MNLAKKKGFMPREPCAPLAGDSPRSQKIVHALVGALKISDIPSDLVPLRSRSFTVIFSSTSHRLPSLSSVRSSSSPLDPVIESARASVEVHRHRPSAVAWPPNFKVNTLPRHLISFTAPAANSQPPPQKVPKPCLADLTTRRASSSRTHRNRQSHRGAVIRTCLPSAWWISAQPKRYRSVPPTSLMECLHLPGSLSKPIARRPHAGQTMSRHDLFPPSLEFSAL